MDRKKQSEEEIIRRIKELNGWKYQEGKLAKDFEFPNFIKAFAFLTEVAIHSESLDHHPKITNVYNKVRLELWTHDANGITEYDFELARLIG